MIKGVNKVIIEVNETDNKFFEKAILYIRPEYCNDSEERLKSRAKQYLDNAFTTQNRFEYSLSEHRKRHRKLVFIIGGYLLVLASTFYFIFLA